MQDDVKANLGQADRAPVLEHFTWRACIEHRLAAYQELFRHTSLPNFQDRWMPRALVVGGTGLIGRATARRLLAAGWDVDVTGRNSLHMPADVAEAGGRFVTASRNDAGQLQAAYGAGADLLVDCLCFTAEDARRLLPLVGDAGSTVMISSKAVYIDALGNHSNSATAPNFEGAIRESQPTMAPSNDVDYNSREGYGASKVAAEQVLLDGGHPVTVLRPSKVHGDGALKPNEWVFVKRILDRRLAVFLARRGAGTDHTSAAANIAALIETVAGKPGRRILNSADPDAPSALEISRIIARHLDYHWAEVLLDDRAEAGLGRHPWDRLPPVSLDMSAAYQLGYQPVGDYATTVASELNWLVSLAGDNNCTDRLPPGFNHNYFAAMLNYAAEDSYLAER